MTTQAELAARIERLETRLRVLEDAEAIRELKARYGELVDARYGRDGPKPAAELEPIARELAGLFTEDAVWDAGGRLGRCEGREAIYRRFLEPTLLASRHLFVKPRIRVEGDVAHATWDLLAPCTTPDGRPHWMAGVEEDEYVRTPDGWLHRRMKLRVLFFETRGS
jgi:hypothetical protein